jgi:threonine/homoserine/homoserine lactone efflux protein
MNRLLSLMITVMVLVMGIGLSSIIYSVPMFVKYIILACSMVFFYTAVLKILEDENAAKKNNGDKQHTNNDL